ncbi:uncharacterized protein LOC119319276 [Triticum dicoccoides]|uniref:uncharacterized protein LOC119319276 n=1 Tax=Triticum dicoccoides TaxID=85692 RepID=UPI0018915DB0|nr:uncharacterized protein LOC119319276 [Triticum dicoccoides]
MALGGLLYTSETERERWWRGRTVHRGGDGCRDDMAGRRCRGAAGGGDKRKAATLSAGRAKGNDYRSKVSGLGACEEEQVLLDQAVWQLQCQGPVSQGPNDLYNVCYYKFSGLANSKTVAVQPSAGEEKAVVLSTSKTKKQDTHAKLLHKTLMRKQFRKMAGHGVLLELRADSPKPTSLEVASQESAYPEVVPGTRPRVGSRPSCRRLLRRRLFVLES